MDRRIALLIFSVILSFCLVSEYLILRSYLFPSKGYLEGVSDGYRDGYEEGYDDGYDSAMSVSSDYAYDYGFDHGYDGGYEEGVKDGKRMNTFNGAMEFLTITSVIALIFFFIAITIDGFVDEILKRIFHREDVQSHGKEDTIDSV